MDMDVCRAGNLRDFGGDLAREFVIGRSVASQNLDIDGGWKAEIQDLVGDVGGLKEKDQIGKFFVEAFTQAVGVLGGRAVRFALQATQDVDAADTKRRLNR